MFGVRHGAPPERLILLLVSSYKHLAALRPGQTLVLRYKHLAALRPAQPLEQQRQVLLNSQTFRQRQRLLNLFLVGALIRPIARKF